MKFLSRFLTPGAPVIHRGLDDERGLAKSGRIEEKIGNDRSALVIAHWQDERGLVGFDNREVERLYNLPLISSGPLLLYPHHVWNLLRYPFRHLAQLLRTS